MRDFVWWSGLTVKDARSGIEMAGKTLAQDDRRQPHVLVVAERARARARPSPVVHLLPNYDECLIAYKDRDNVGHSRRRPIRASRGWAFSRIRCAWTGE